MKVYLFLLSSFIITVIKGWVTETEDQTPFLPNHYDAQQIEGIPQEINWAFSFSIDWRPGQGHFIEGSVKITKTGNYAAYAINDQGDWNLVTRPERILADQYYDIRIYSLNIYKTKLVVIGEINNDVNPRLICSPPWNPSVSLNRSYTLGAVILMIFCYVLYRYYYFTTNQAEL